MLKYGLRSSVYTLLLAIIFKFKLNKSSRNRTHTRQIFQIVLIYARLHYYFTDKKKMFLIVPEEILLLLFNIFFHVF